MYKNLRWKLLTIAAVFVVFFAVGVYPLLGAKYHWPVAAVLQAKALKLGLDLQGGVEPTIPATGPTTFRVEGVPSDRDQQFRSAADEVAQTDFDRNTLPGGTY